MSLYRRGKVWWYRFEFQGKPFERSTRTRNRVAAQKIESKLRTDLALGLYGLQPTKPGPTFSDYSKKFLEFVETHSKDQPETIEFYRSTIARLLLYKPLANCRLNFIDEAMVEGYTQHRRKAVSTKTLNNELTALRRALNVARKKLKLMTTAVSISLLSGANERTFVLSHTQEDAYLAACCDVLRDAAILMLDTGLRVGKCVQVKWEDLASDWSRLTVPKSKGKRAVRSVRLSLRCREMLANRSLFRLDGELYVFPGRTTHISVSALEDYHLTARNAARLEDGSELPPEFLIHSLRHTFATRFGEVAENAFIVKEGLGHSDIRMSQKYVHPRTEATDRALERLDALNRLMREGPDEIRDSADVDHRKH